jgi:hypothetical protein
MKSYEDTWNTLQYANRAKEIKYIKPPVIRNGAAYTYHPAMRISQNFTDGLELCNQSFELQEESIIERSNEHDLTLLDPLKCAIQNEIKCCTRSLKDLTELYEKSQEILQLQLQKEQEVSLFPNNSILREELRLLDASYKSHSSAIDRIKNKQSSLAQQSIKFRLQIDSLQLIISNNKYILYELLTRYQSYCESMNHLMTNKSLELEIQLLKNQLEKIQKDQQQINFISHPTVYCPATVSKQSTIFGNRRGSLVPITPARNFVPADRLGTTTKRQSLLSRQQPYPSIVHPDRPVRMSTYVAATSKKSVYAPINRLNRENPVPHYKKNEFKISYFPNPLAPKNS